VCLEDEAAWGSIPVPPFQTRLSFVIWRLCQICQIWVHGNEIHPQDQNQAPMSACQPLNRRLAEVSVGAADSQPATAPPDHTACFPGRPIVPREPPCMTSTSYALLGGPAVPHGSIK
jgi:hypothetical protein